MSNQVDSKPSTVLIESYNERMSKFLLPESVHNATVVIGETDSDGVAIASITIPGKKTITTKVKRSRLETTVTLTNIDELDGGKFMRLVMEDQAVIESAANDITSAMGINSTKDFTDLTTEQATELEENVMFSAALWVNQGIFVPPFDFTRTDISDEYTEHLANNDNIQGVFEVEAKPNSLGFVGSVKGVTLTQAITTPPDPTYSLDLDKVTNGDTPGQWTLEVDVESDEVPVASVLTELALTAVNNAHDTTITTDDVTSNLEGKTLTIYTLKENASNITGTLIVTVILNVTPPPVVKFDLNTLTNTDSPGTWIHEYDEGADFNAEALIVANQLVEVINLTFDQVVVTSDLAITAEPPNIISISPSLTGRDKLDGMIFVQAKVKPKPIVKFDLSTITNGDEVGVWTLDIDEDELSEVTAQSATQVVLDVFNVSSDIQITYDQLDVVKEDTIITVTPSNDGAEVLEGSFIITLNVIINEVPPIEEPTEFNLSMISNVDEPGQWTLEVDVESDEVPAAAVLTELTLTAVNTAHETTIAVADVSSNLEDNTLTVHALEENASNITGTLVVTVILNVTPPPVVKFDLSTITNGTETGVWTLDVNEGELSEVTAQSATQVVLDTFNATSDTQITYDQLDAVKEDTLVTVTPNESGSELLEGAFIITLNVIADLP